MVTNRKVYILLYSTKSMTNTSRIERGMTKLIVPHNGKEIVFAYPSIGPNTYRNVGESILKSKQSVPTGDYTSSLVHSAYCSNISNEPESKNIKNILTKRWLWVYNQNLWTDKGVYVIQDLKAEGKFIQLKQGDLEKMLKGAKDINGLRFNKNNKVRYAPKESYKLGDHTSDSFSKDGFVIISCGKEGAEKLGEVSSKFNNKNPYLFGLVIKKGQTPEQRVSTLGEDLDDRLLYFDGDFDVDIGGCAFGVHK